MTRITSVHGDIAAQEVDAVVNAANERLVHGGGVAGAIARAGGPAIQHESDRWVADNGPLSPGVAAVTGAGTMPARWVVHVAGPHFRDGQDNRGLLEAAVRAALDAATGVGARSVALPALSSGVFGYPLNEATAVIVGAVSSWCVEHPNALSEIRLVGWDEQATTAFEDALNLT